MSFQAGVLYFDGREIEPGETQAVCGCVSTEVYCRPTTYREPGLLMAYAGPAPAEPYVGGRGIVTFDGRLDNRPELVRRCPGVVSPESGEAALALSVYQSRGTHGLADLIGDWSLAIWEPTDRALLLASDYAGIRPLYYHVNGQRVVWSTRLRPLVNLAEAYEIDDAYVAGLLSFAAFPNHTPYRGVYSVPPGSAVCITAGGVKTVRFWELPVGERICYQRESEYEEQLVSLFQDAVKCRIPDGSRCLAELSGGLDSSSVVAMAAGLIRSGAAKPASFCTLTVEHEDSRDTPFYAAMESACGFESIHRDAGEHPFLTATETGGAQPAFWAALQKDTARLTRDRGVTTYLTGKLGDDVMGNWWDDSDQVAGLLRDGQIGAAVGSTFAWSRALRIPAAWILLRALRASLPPWLGLAAPNRWNGIPETAMDREDSIAPGLRGRIGPADSANVLSRTWMQARPERRRHCLTLTQAFALRRLQAPEPFEHLDYVHPFAHRPLVAFMLAIPPAVVCGPGEPRRLMRRAFARLWPENLRRRRSKDGFGGVFLDSLRPLADEMRKPNQRLRVVERGYVDSASLRRRLDRLALSLNCNEAQLRQIILLEFWLRGLESDIRGAPETRLQAEVQ